MIGRVRALIDGAILVIAVASIAAAVTLRLLPLTGHEVVSIAGGSMEPFLSRGALVVLETAAPEALRVGDVVSIRTGVHRAVVTHRIARLVDREGDVWLELRGDANEEPDPTIVPASAVLGRVAMTIPGAGRLLGVAATPAGFLVVVGISGLLYGLSLALWSLANRRAARLEAAPG